MFNEYRADIHVIHDVHQTVDNFKSQRILRAISGNFYRGTYTPINYAMLLCAVQL